MEVVDSSKNTVSLLEFFGNNARRDSSAPIAEPPRADFALLCEAGRRRRKGNKLRPLRQAEEEEDGEGEEDEFLLCVVAWRPRRKRA